MTTLAETLDHAMRHHQQGHLAQAEQLYRQILQVDPQNVDALHLLGVLAHQVGRYDQALDYLSQAVRLNPHFAEAHNNLGNALKEQGKLAAAVTSYRQAIRLKPNLVEVHNNLGSALQSQGELDEAVACYQQALRLKPDYAEAYNNLGGILQSQGRLDEAVTCYRRALLLKPDLAEAHKNLGSALQGLGELDEAVACYRQALRHKPDLAEAHDNLGSALQSQGKLEEAVACYRQALRLKPDYAEAHNNLGNALQNQGSLGEAVACYRQALRLNPDYAGVHNSLGNAFQNQGKLEEAVACYQQALRLKPDYDAAYNNLASALQNQGKLEEAVACYQQALRLKPDYAEAHNNLGNALKDQGQLDEAIACYRRAVQLKADYAGAHSNLVYTLYFCPGSEARALFEELRRWSQQHAEPLARFMQPHANDRSPDRRLRVGYVSPDFRNHAESFFTVPLLSSHDHQNFEIFCYADVARPDSITARLRGYADVWRNIVGLTDEQIAQLVHQDRIDILMDLTMHMGRNHLLVFARNPAPVQVCWLAYQGSTGLSTIDYRLTDPYVDPPGLDDRYYSEESIRLPDSFGCYDPLTDEPDVNTLPAIERGYVTFGSLNNFCKINALVLKLWAQVLKTVDRSQLIVLAPEGAHRQHTLDRLEHEGIAPDRVAFFGFRPRLEYLQLYHQIDIGLDTFPYNGQTTSLDAFWMGVPVVTITGQTAVGRAGLSLLRNLGLPEMIGDNPEQFVSIAAELAMDLPRLSKLRATLRNRLENSPLMDAPRFARNVEDAYRSVWQRWCAKK